MKLLAKIIRFVLLACIRFYQYALSPLLPASCRFIPSCSEYAIAAIQKHGNMQGVFYALVRIFRCHPWGKQGHDPIP